MNLSDKAIENISDDKLGRSSFSKRISEFINDYKEVGSFSLGLTGNWGTGKTSIINMIKETNRNNKSSNILIYEFNPWDISTRKQLFSDFFSGMSSVLESEEGIKIEKAKEISQKLKLYANIFKPLKYIPALSPVLEAVSDILNITSDNLKVYSESKENDLFGLKNELNALLKEQNKKVLIIIDDIDRLSDGEIKEVFHLIKSVGNLSNTFYLLSYDKNLVTSVMNKVQEGRGQEYTEKLINLEINVPQIKKEAINEIFKEDLLLIFPELCDKRKYNPNIVISLFECILDENFFNLREVKRFLNIMSLLSSFAKRLNIIDFIIVQFLKEYKIDVYERIKNKGFKPESDQKLLKLLYRNDVPMFYMFNYEECNFNGREFLKSNYRYQYFTLDIENIPEEVSKCKDSNELVRIILQDKEKGKIYVKKILSSLMDIPKDKVIIYFESIMKTLYIANDLDTITFQGQVYKDLLPFVKEIENKNEIKKIIKDIKIDNYDYREFMEFLNILNKDYDVDVEEIRKNHIESILSKNEIDYKIFYLFNELEEGIFNEFLSKCFKDDNKIFDFIRCSQDYLYYPCGDIAENEPELEWINIIFYEDIDKYYNYDELVNLVNNITRELTEEEKELKRMLLAKNSRDACER